MVGGCGHLSHPPRETHDDGADMWPGLEILDVVQVDPQHLLITMEEEPS